MRFNTGITRPGLASPSGLHVSKVGQDAPASVNPCLNTVQPMPSIFLKKINNIIVELQIVLEHIARHGSFG